MKIAILLLKWVILKATITSEVTFFSGQQKQADSVIVSAEMDNLSYQYFLEGFLTGNGTIK